MDERKSAREAAARAVAEVIRDAFDRKARPVTDVSDAAIDAYEAALKAGGWVIVPREALVEKLGRALAQQGHDLSADSMVIYEDDDGHECQSPYWLFHEYDQEAEAAIRAMLAASEAEKG